MKALATVVAGMVLAAAAPAHAHTMSDGHLNLVPDGDRLVGTLDVAIRDLHDAFGLDPDADGQIKWSDLSARQPAIADYVVKHLSIKSADGACALTTGGLGVVDRPDGTHVAIRLTATCPAPAVEVVVDYHLLYELDAQHRGLIQIGDGHAIARNGDGPISLTVRTGTLPRLAAAVPGHRCTLTLGAGALVLLLAGFALRRTSKLPLVVILAIAAGAAAPIAWSIHRLVS